MRFIRIFSIFALLFVSLGFHNAESIEFTIFSDSGEYNFGDRMNIFISCSNGNEGMSGDLYIMLLDPTGKLYFMPDQSLKYFTVPRWTNILTHAVPDLFIPDRFTIKDLNLFSFNLPGLETDPPVFASGDYVLGIAFTRPDTLDIVNIFTYPFHFNSSISHSQSDCIGDLIYTDQKGDEETDFDGKIDVSVKENNVTINHIGVVYNCAAVIKFITYFESEYEIVMIEHEILPMGPANCLCGFNLKTKIENLKPGSYSLRVYKETTAYLFGEFEFEIEGDFSYKSTNCKGKPTSGSYYSDESFSHDGKVTLTIDGNTLFMKHTDVEYNCAAHILLTSRVEDNVITFVELETYGKNGPVYCLCLFDVNGTLQNIEPGEYTVRVVNESTGKKFSEEKIKIENEKLSYKQSECKGEPTYFYPESEDSEEESVVIFVKDGSIVVQHFNVVYNCGAVIVPEVKTESGKIIIREIETLPNGAMRCMCRFDFEAIIDVYEKGTYIVELWNEDFSKMFGSEAVTIE